MREALRPYTGINRLNYLCIIASELLGEFSLASLPSLASGFESVEKTLSQDVVVALHNIRLANIAPTTMRELHLMVDAYRLHYRQLELRLSRGDEGAKDELPQRYKINDDLTIRRSWTHLIPDDVVEALGVLTSVQPLRHREPPPLHDGSKTAEIVADPRYSGVVLPLGFSPEDPPMYNLDRVGEAPGMVKWESLVEVANRFDEIDEERGRQQPGERSWFKRLHDAEGSR